eukprot:3201446-Alexandrium_andersonii.AAC.1
MGARKMWAREGQTISGLRGVNLRARWLVQLPQMPVAAPQAPGRAPLPHAPDKLVCYIPLPATRNSEAGPRGGRASAPLSV